MVVEARVLTNPRVHGAAGKKHLVYWMPTRLARAPRNSCAKTHRRQANEQKQRLVVAHRSPVEDSPRCKIAEHNVRQHSEGLDGFGFFNRRHSCNIAISIQ